MGQTAPLFTSSFDMKMTKTKKIIMLMGLLVFAVILIPIILICFAFGLAPQYDESFYGGMKIKYNRLKSIEKSKIVVIGGSSVAFGLRSDIMENELKMPVVNFGLYANLGTKYMLDVAKDYIKEGDIVIIAPEQNSQALSLYFNAEAVWYTADGNYGVLSDVAGDNFGDMAKEFLSFVSGKFGYWQSGGKPCPDGVYNVHSFNNYGDIEYARPYNIMTNYYDAGMAISFKQDVIGKDFINYINAYGKDIISKGATVLYSFCPMNIDALDEESDDKTQKQYYDYLTSELNFPVIGSPETHLIDSNWFYDSNFHLNDAGAVYYTTLLAQELKAEINDFTPILTDVPEMPQKPVHDDSVQGTISQDLMDASKIFNLGGVTITSSNGEVLLTGSWTIKGLTEYGSTLKDITIPDSLAGLPVTGISDECFMDNDVITSITFGVNISFVGRDVFKNCHSLRAIYITSLDPDTYHPALDIFDGLADCAFYVPQEVYTSQYVPNYFWGALGRDRLKAYSLSK